jgi:DNA-directed RNA polymerase subunit omega
VNKPTIDELMRKVESKYALAVLAAKRARMLTENEKPLTNGKAIKTVTVALHEIASGKIRYERTKSGIK